MPAETLLTNRFLRIDEIEKYERLNHLTDVGGADHANDRTVHVAARAEDHLQAAPAKGVGGVWMTASMRHSAGILLAIDDVPGQMSVSVCA